MYGVLCNYIFMKKGEMKRKTKQRKIDIFSLAVAKYTTISHIYNLKM